MHHKTKSNVHWNNTNTAIVTTRQFIKILMLEPDAIVSVEGVGSIVGIVVGSNVGCVVGSSVGSVDGSVVGSVGSDVGP